MAMPAHSSLAHVTKPPDQNSLSHISKIDWFTWKLFSHLRRSSCCVCFLKTWSLFFREARWQSPAVHRYFECSTISTTGPVVEHRSHRKSQRLFLTVKLLSVQLWNVKWTETETEGGLYFSVDAPCGQFVTNLLMMKQANTACEIAKGEIIRHALFHGFLWKLWNRQRSRLDAPFTDLCCHQSRLLTLQ